jgi:hypothetical protein
MPGDISLASSSAGNYFLLTKHIIAPVLNTVGDPKIPVSVLPPGLSCLSPKSLQAGTGVKENVICPLGERWPSSVAWPYFVTAGGGGAMPCHLSERPGACPLKSEGINFMTMNLKHWVLAAALASGIGGLTLQADDTKDYSKSKQYQQGVKEGQYDHAHNLDHSKKRHFKKDEDRQAYEQGYQKGIVVVVK